MHVPKPKRPTCPSHYYYYYYYYLLLLLLLCQSTYVSHASSYPLSLSLYPSPPLCAQKMHQTQHTLAAVENKENKENNENKENKTKTATVTQIRKSQCRVILYADMPGH